MKTLTFLLCMICSQAIGVNRLAPLDTKKFETVVEERIVNLPQDQKKWYLTVIVKVNDAQSTSVKSWFEKKDLFILRKTVHYNAVSTDSQMWKIRYKRMYRNENCCVRLQNHKGIVVYQATGNNLPDKSDKLFL